MGRLFRERVRFLLHIGGRVTCLQSFYVVLSTGSPCGEALQSPGCWSTSKMLHCTCHSPGSTWSLPDRGPTLCFSHWHSSLSSPWSLTRWYRPLQKKGEQISKPDRGFCKTNLRPTHTGVWASPCGVHDPLSRQEGLEGVGSWWLPRRKEMVVQF